MGREAGPLTPGQHVRVHKNHAGPSLLSLTILGWLESFRASPNSSRRVKEDPNRPARP